MDDKREKLSIGEKALRLNLDHKIYGTFAEIGAGQEVARCFFQAGAAGGTVASTISAYDMAFSDHLYGKSARYVCRERVEQMLRKEYQAVTGILQDSRPKGTQFFAYANTVSVRSYGGGNQCHGWMGIRFQCEQGGAQASEIIIHVRLLDSDSIAQSQAVGVCGVNLCYAAYYLHHDMDAFIDSLMDDTSNEHIEIDMISVSGPLFSQMDNRVLSLKLVKREMAAAVLFESDGSVVQPADIFYKKDIILLRGSFRPPTQLNMDMIRCAEETYFQHEQHKRDQTLTVANITLANLRSATEQGEVNDQDFLARVDLLGGLGQRVLITKFTEYHWLNQYFERFKNQRVRFVLGIYNLMSLFEESAYQNLSGGIMEGFGRLFDRDTKLYVYPYKEEDGSITDCHHFDYPRHLKYLYLYLMENGYIHPLTNHDPQHFSIWSRVVLEMIQRGERGWEEKVPPFVAEEVKRGRLFGYREGE